MANENEPDVKIVERVEVAPAGGDNVDEEKETLPDSSQEETDETGEKDEEEKPESEETESEEDEESEAEEESKPAPQNAAPETDPDEGKKYEELQRIPGETAKEWALRLTNARLRDQLRGNQSKEIFTPPPATAKKELSPEQKAKMAKFKPEDMALFKEALEVVADDLGFVKKDDLGATTYQEKATEVLDGFLEKHPEYLPQNDPGNVLWARFKEEFALYKPTQNPRDLKKVLDKVHKEVFGIKPAAAFNKQDAAKEKIKVASHSGSSRPAPSREGVKRGTQATPGLRLDMLKGFSEDEIAELGGTE